MYDEIDSDGIAGDVLAHCISVSYFGSDPYSLAMGFRQETRGCFSLTDIRTNQQRTLLTNNGRKKKYTKRSFSRDNNNTQKKIRTNRHSH